ncbi:hypothetical protein AX14_002401 [Amanita brunnescens Koide BX004]|nr:hypothetical protein AX14_002401 [Amanita brunnescens Koide BX004]
MISDSPTTGKLERQSASGATSSTPQTSDSKPLEINENTLLSDLTPSQLIDLNQNALNDLVPQRPLIEDAEPISGLRAEYELGSATFLKQIDWLKDQGFHYLRRARGDGDCFYRALGFAFVEQILEAPENDVAAVSALSLLETTSSSLEAVGFQRIVYEDFYDVLYGLIKSVVQPDDTQPLLTLAGLLQTFQNPEVSNCIVVYLRLLTSAQLRLNEEEYSPFLTHPESGEPMMVGTFCEKFVEATGKEADHVQITALCSVLRLNVKVAYLDGRGDTGTVEYVEFQNEPAAKEPITLLYRPGHYDILIKSPIS